MNPRWLCFGALQRKRHWPWGLAALLLAACLDASDLQGVPPPSPKAHALWRQGSDLLDAGRLEAARRAFEMALKISPQFHDALYSLGVASRKSGDFQRAVQAFQDLLRIDPRNVDAWFQLGLSYASLGRYGQAVDAYRMALAYNDACGPCRCALALALRENRRWAESLRESQSCVELLPEYGGGWNLLGIARMDQADFEAAEKAFARAVELSPNYANAWYNRGQALGFLRRWREAEQAFSKYAALSPGAEAFCALGEARLKAGKLVLAEQAFRRALALEPEAALPHWGLARLARAKGEYKRARREEESYRRAARWALADPGAYFSEPSHGLKQADLQVLNEAWEESHAARPKKP